MQIHELNNFTGTLGAGSYVPIDDGNDTGKLSHTAFLAPVNARIDNIIAGEAPSAEEIVDARLGADGVPYPSLGDAIRDQFTDVKSALNRVSNYNSINLVEINAIINNNKINLTADGRSVYVKLESGKAYKILVKGAFNRFIVGECNSLSNNSSVTLLSAKSGTFTEEYYEYIADGTYSYLFITIAYSYGSYNLSEAYAYFVNTATQNERYLFNENVSNKGTTNGDFSEIVTGTRYSDRLPDLADKIISASEGSNFDVFTMANDGYYNIEVTGDFNRFGVYVGNSVEINQTLTLLHFETAVGSSFANKKYTYQSDGTYKYLIILSNYPYSNSKSTASCVFSTLEDSDEITINGFETYTKQGVEKRLLDFNADLSSVLSNYVSDESVSVVTTASEVYALYDALVTSYPDFVTKTILGQDDFNNDIIQYEFTSGNYNSYTGVLRYQDTSIAKPKILIISGIHGYERTSVMGTYQFFLDMCQGANNLLELRGNYDFKVIPLGDPWSFNNNTRTNGNGVNVDDNFDINWVYEYEGTQNFSGWSAADQPETQIVQSWINANTDAVLYIDHHNSGYEDEVSYVGANDSYNNVPTFKRLFLDAMYKFMPYLQIVEGFADDLYYAYTGHFNNWSSSYNYAGSKGLTGICLETSWNQNGSGLHSDLSIKTSAEVLGNTLKYYLEEN